MQFEISDKVAVLHLEDGKANAVGYEFIDAVEHALDRAQAEAHALVLAGRPGVFSAGFDLKEMQKSEEARHALVRRGAQLLQRLFAHPQPTVAACTGHALAAGALLLLACDSRIAAEGDFKIGLNETAIGMVLPVFGVELARARLDVRHLTAAVTQARIYGINGAQAAGFLDDIEPANLVVEKAVELARALAELPAEAYAANKRSIRQPTIDLLSAALA